MCRADGIFSLKLQIRSEIIWQNPVLDSKYGARPLRRAIQNKLEDPMANEILEGRIRTGDTVKVQLHQKKICFIPVRDTE